MSLTYTEQLQRMVTLYRQSGGKWPTSTRMIAAWAIEEGYWQPKRDTLVTTCAEDISRALRDELIIDPQGRRVRAKHFARTLDEQGGQLLLWADIRTASPEHMRIAFQQRRKQIVGDCRQLKNDVDSYNDNANPLEPVQVCFDFTEDLAEMGLNMDSDPFEINREPGDKV